MISDRITQDEVVRIARSVGLNWSGGGVDTHMRDTLYLFAARIIDANERQSRRARDEGEPPPHSY